MPILDIQKRARELGRIRLGQKGDKGQPQKLDRFRLTSASEALLTKVAELYGGDVQAWTPAGGSPQFEVITGSARLPIMVPPQPVTQWYEYWTKGGCQHRCDGQHNVLTDDDCDHDDPAHIEALKKPTTRLNVVLRDVEGIGVWRVETHGWNAAVELPDVAEFLASAGGYVNGWLALEQRTSIDNSSGRPQTRHFAVPIIEIDVTPAQLMAGHGRVAAPALAGGPVTEAPALAAAGPDYVALAADLATVDDLKALYKRAYDAGHMTQGLADHLTRRSEELKAAEVPAEQVPDADGVVEAEVIDEPAGAADPVKAEDADAIWQQILTVGGRHGMTLADVNVDFAQAMGGLDAAAATAGELQVYLDKLLAAEAAQTEQVPA